MTAMQCCRSFQDCQSQKMRASLPLPSTEPNLETVFLHLTGKRCAIRRGYEKSIGYCFMTFCVPYAAVFVAFLCFAPLLLSFSFPRLWGREESTAISNMEIALVNQDAPAQGNPNLVRLCWKSFARTG
jgi:hypothetical protein